MAKWDDCPVEVKTAILQLVDNTTLYATVCRQWQAILERKHFERIQLSRERLPDFAEIVQGPRRKLVQHIMLRVELAEYQCCNCWKRENPDEKEANSLLFKHALKSLFTILSNWERPGDLNDKGLTLELCVYSPSDSKHCFGRRRFEYDPYSEPPEAFRREAQIHLIYTDDSFHWRPASIHELQNASTRVTSPPEWACVSNDDLPMVVVVTTFMIRRQYYRDISPNALADIFKSLVGLEHVIYERPGYQLDGFLDSRHRNVLGCLPNTVKRLAIFEDHNRILAKLMGQPRRHTAWCRSVAILEYATTLVAASRNLEHLSTSFLIDAQSFFYSFWPSNNDYSLGWKWDKLATLALTSHLLDPDHAREEVNDLLEAAGTAARNMPQLRMMEIWNGKLSDTGCLFRYCTNDDSSTITWRSTWEVELVLEDRVIVSWTRTVRQNTRHENLAIVFERLPKDNTSIGFPASVLRHLKLRDRIVHPISFGQIQALPVWIMICDMFLY
ncbi:hypothetical protein F4818DRAFT_452960 [Hypoxylon cercidicola]|nr:hypothetical protein F4818DRAFT_452960 [Hypoxylon cercidicola]